MQTTDRFNGALAAIPCDQSISPSRIHTPPENRDISLESVQDLVTSIHEHGQLVELLLYPHPTRPGEWMCADGNRRLIALRFLNKDARARLLDKAPTEAELIALRLTIDNTRKAMDKADIGADVWRWIELTGASQDAAAEAFRFSPGYISKLLAPFKRGIDPLIQLLKEGKVSGTACAIVAALTPDQQLQALEEMKPLLAAQGKVKRDTAERISNRIKGKQEKRPKPTKFACCGVAGVIRGDVLQAMKTFHTRLSEALKRIDRDPALADLLPSLLKG